MGEYLSTPNKEKEVEEGNNSSFRYGVVGMQGWRKSMEDSHIAHLDVIPGEVSIFGVFDGHGGCEVAHFISYHFVDEIKKLDSFKRGDYKNALIEVFLHVDQMLLTESGKRELGKIA
jgi:serine/threonine protein phosphatase PrpC